MNNTQYMIDRLTKQKEEIDSLIRQYQTIGQTPVNNFINTQSQSQPRDFVELRVLNENEEVDNLYVQNKTLFINDHLMILKGVDGSLEKWEVKKVYPVDKKDLRINELEEEIKKLKERMNYEHAESTSTIGGINKSDADVNGNDNRESETISEPISTKE